MARHPPCSVRVPCLFLLGQKKKRLRSCVWFNEIKWGLGERDKTHCWTYVVMLRQHNEHDRGVTHFKTREERDRNGK